MQIKDKVLFNVGRIQYADVKLPKSYDEAYGNLSGFLFYLVAEHFVGWLSSSFKPNIVEGAGFVAASDDTGDAARSEIQYIADPRILAVWLQCIYDVWTNKKNFNAKKITTFPTKEDAVKWLKTPHQTKMYPHVVGKPPPENEPPMLTTNWVDFDDFSDVQTRIDEWRDIVDTNYHETLRQEAAGV